MPTKEKYRPFAKRQGQPPDKTPAPPAPKPKAKPISQAKAAGIARDVAIAAIEAQIVDAMPKLLNNLMILADGVKVMREDENGGGSYVYEKPPDRRANEYLLNRIMGDTKAKLKNDQIQMARISVIEIARPPSSQPTTQGVVIDVSDPDAHHVLAITAHDSQS